MSHPVIRRFALLAALLAAGAVAAQSVSVTFFPLDPNPRENLAPVLESFTDQTGIEVENFEVVPWSGGQERIVSALAAGRGSDVIYTTTGRALQLVDLGAVRPLSDRLTEDFLVDTYGSVDVAEQFRYEGELYLAPFVRNAHVWVVNRDAFERAGVDDAIIEEMTDPEGSWNWDDLERLAEELTADTDGDGDVDQWGYAYPGGDDRASPFLRLYWNFETDVIGADGTVHIGGDETRTIFEFLDRVNDAGWMPPGSESLSASEIEDLFADGRVGMIQTDLLGPVQDAVADGNFEIVYPPEAPNGGRGNFVAFDSLVVNDATGDPDAAWSLVEFLVTGEAFSDYLLSQNLSPASGIDPELANDPVFQRKFEVENTLVESFYTRHEAFHPSGPAIIDAYNAETQAVLSGAKDPEQAAEDLRAAVERAIE